MEEEEEDEYKAAEDKVEKKEEGTLFCRRALPLRPAIQYMSNVSHNSTFMVHILDYDRYFHLHIH